MNKILIVADDLTGALDSAVAFAERGLKTLVVHRPEGLPEALAAKPDVLSLATGTRERSAADAIRTVESMVAPLVGWPDMVFKKVDSRLKGHVAQEVSSVARLLGSERIIIAPAIPEFGRIVKNGLLTGQGIEHPIDIASRFADLPLPCDIPDVQHASDFARALSDMDDATLLVGARGLAAALAEKLSGPKGNFTATPKTPLLIAIGSRDPITLAQVEAIQAHQGLLSIAAPNGVMVDKAQGPLVLAQMTAGLPPCGSTSATAQFATGLAALAEHMRPAAIFASGGETADSLLGELGIGVLNVIGELLPGIPTSQFRHDGRKITLITKSGGFGAPETLQTLIGMIG